MSVKDLAPLFDIELESMLDDEAKCSNCTNVATLIYSHRGRCATLLCIAHAERTVDFLAQAARGVVTLACDVCGLDPLDPSTVTMREV